MILHEFRNPETGMLAWKFMDPFIATDEFPSQIHPGEADPGSNNSDDDVYYDDCFFDEDEEYEPYYSFRCSYH